MIDSFDFADTVFGSHLVTICDKEKSTIPKFVVDCIHAVETRGNTNLCLYDNLETLFWLWIEMNLSNSNSLEFH